MRRRLGLVVITVLLGACGDEPTGSRFNGEDKKGREVAGNVSIGEDLHAGAQLSIGWPRRWGPPPSPPTNLVADVNGFYYGVRAPGTRYDLDVNLGDYLLSYGGLGARFLRTTVEQETPSLARGWRTKIDLQVTPEPTAEQTVTLFAFGGGVFGIEGSYEDGFSLVTTEFAVDTGVVVVVHERGKDLSTAVATARWGLRSNPEVPQLVQVTVEPIAKRVTHRVDVDGPATVTFYSSVTRTSFAKLATVAAGESIDLPVIADNGISIRVERRVGGTFARSAELGVNAEKPPELLVLPAPPTASSPDDGAVVGADVELVARGVGVFEHVLVSEEGRPEIRLVSTDGVTTLPDYSRIGAEPPKGRYLWTVRHYPGLKFVEQLTGVDARRFVSMAASEPRTLVFP